MQNPFFSERKGKNMDVFSNYDYDFYCDNINNNDFENYTKIKNISKPTPYRRISL